jgi:hypothetical protein
VGSARARAAAAKSREIAAHARAAALHDQAAELHGRLGNPAAADRERKRAASERDLIEVARSEATEPRPVREAE